MRESIQDIISSGAPHPMADWEAVLARAGGAGGKAGYLKSLLDKGLNFIDFEKADQDLYPGDVYDDMLASDEDYLKVLEGTGSKFKNSDFAIGDGENSDAVKAMLKAIEGQDIDDDYIFDPDSEGASEAVMNYIAEMLSPQSRDLEKVKLDPYLKRIVPHILGRERDYLDDIEKYLSDENMKDTAGTC